MLTYGVLIVSYQKTKLISLESNCAISDIITEDEAMMRSEGKLCKLEESDFCDDI